MHIVAIDNHIERLEEMESALHESFPDDEIRVFCDPLMALKYLFTHGGDIVFTELEMKPIGGHEVAEIIHKQCGDVDVYCIADTEDIDSHEFSACITRPVSDAKIKSVFQTA